MVFIINRWLFGFIIVSSVVVIVLRLFGVSSVVCVFLSCVSVFLSVWVVGLLCWLYVSGVLCMVLSVLVL